MCLSFVHNPLGPWCVHIGFVFFACICCCCGDDNDIDDAFVINFAYGNVQHKTHFANTLCMYGENVRDRIAKKNTQTHSFKHRQQQCLLQRSLKNLQSNAAATSVAAYIKRCKCVAFPMSSSSSYIMIVCRTHHLNVNKSLQTYCFCCSYDQQQWRWQRRQRRQHQLRQMSSTFRECLLFHSIPNEYCHKLRSNG